MSGGRFVCSWRCRRRRSRRRSACRSSTRTMTCLFTVVAHEDDVRGVVGLEHPEEDGRPLLEVAGGQRPQPERPHAAVDVRAELLAQRLRVRPPRRVELLRLAQVLDRERHIHIRLHGLEAGDLEVVALLDDLVSDIDVLGSQRLELLHRPLHQLLPVRRQPELPRYRLRESQQKHPLSAVVGYGVGLVGPAPDDAAALGRVVERLGCVEVAVVVAEAVVVVGEGGVGDVPVGGVVVPADGVVLVPRQVEAHLEHVLDLLRHGGVVQLGGVDAAAVVAAPARHSDGEEVRALPHPGVRRVQRVVRLDPLLEVPAPVQHGEPLHVHLAADEEPPVAVGPVPGGGRVAERAGVDAAVRVDDGVVVGLVPLAEVRVGEVHRVGDVLDLPLVGVDAGVHDHRHAAGEHGGGARPAALLVERLGRVDPRLQRRPVDQVRRNRVRPLDVPPHGALGVVLVEQMVQALIVHRTCTVTRIPLLGWLEVVPGPELPVDVLRLQRLELRVDDVRRAHHHHCRHLQQSHKHQRGPRPRRRH
ncbi:Os04g0413301, partial [Oryza sativa Japonica Group]